VILCHLKYYVRAVGCAVILFWGSQQQLVAQPDQALLAQIESRNGLWMSKIQSFSYLLKEYSERTPQHALLLDYKEDGESFYSESRIESPETSRTFRGNVVSWNGTQSMRLRQDTSILYINNKPPSFSNEWRNLNGLWSGFRFVQVITTDDSVRYPAFTIIQEYITRKSDKGITKLEKCVFEGEECISAVSDGGVDLMDYAVVSVKTYFSLPKDYYPIAWELYRENKKLKSRHLVGLLGYQEVEKVKIPYLQKLKSIYYKEDGTVSNTVISEYSNVEFNTVKAEDFDVDPSQATKIVDEANGGKVIVVPK
jgi:hypothetical protein